MVVRKPFEERMSLGATAEEILSSPTLRRKSGKNLSSRLDTSEFLPQNDDEAERRERRRQSESFANLKDKRVSLGGIADFSAAELVAHYANCIKLSTENKINTKNAFSLQLIDYMTAMLKKKDSSMNNFQVASCTLDASTKIYASRVDRVHMDGVKMAGGLGVLSSRKKKAANDDDDNMDEDGDTSTSKRPKRSKKPKRCVSKNETALNANVEEDYRLDPLYMYMNSKFGDSQPGFINFMGHMNIRDDQSDLIMFPTERYWQTTNCELSESCSVAIPSLPDVADKKVCPAFRGVWLDVNKTSLDNFFPKDQPDLDVEIDMVAEPEDDEEGADNFGFNDDDTVVSGEAPAVSCRALQKSGPTDIIDIREHLSDKPLEYSYFNLDKLSLWAGPSHWKIRPLAKEKNDKSVDKESTAATKNDSEKRERRISELKFDDLSNLSSSYVKGRSLLISKRTMEKSWSVDKNTNPQDEHYDEKKLTRMFLRKHARGPVLAFASEAPANEDKDVAEYDYNNLNDSQNYCPNVTDDDDNGNNDDSCSFAPSDDVHSGEHGAGGWQLVPPPPKIARIDIAYATSEKKLNMKKLKGAIWEFLTDGKTVLGNVNHVNTRNRPSADGDNARMTGPVSFRELYRRLKSDLPKVMTEDLSFHIAFTALLHLCNEKVLRLTRNSDHSDVLIAQDQ